MAITPTMKLREIYKKLKLDSITTILFESETQPHVMCFYLKAIDPKVSFDMTNMLRLSPTQQTWAIKRLIYDKLEEILDELAEIERKIT